MLLAYYRRVRQRGRVPAAAGESLADAWRNADSDLQRFVEEAKAGLKRLGTDERQRLTLRL